MQSDMSFFFFSFCVIHDLVFFVLFVLLEQTHIITASEIHKSVDEIQTCMQFKSAAFAVC